MIRKSKHSDIFDSMDEYWSPVVIHELNGQFVKAAKVKGEFVWHAHEDEDEYFQVVRGQLRIELKDGSIELAEGESVVIPKGMEHRPVAEDECWILLFEPQKTDHTGGVDSPLRKDVKDQLGG